jgi:hypothetical protein
MHSSAPKRMNEILGLVQIQINKRILILTRFIENGVNIYDLK